MRAWRPPSSWPPRDDPPHARLSGRPLSQSRPDNPTHRHPRKPRPRKAAYAHRVRHPLQTWAMGLAGPADCAVRRRVRAPGVEFGRCRAHAVRRGDSGGAHGRRRVGPVHRPCLGPGSWIRPPDRSPRCSGPSRHTGSGARSPRRMAAGSGGVAHHTAAVGGAGLGWWHSTGIEYVAFGINTVLLLGWGLLASRAAAVRGDEPSGSAVLTRSWEWPSPWSAPC